MDDTHDRIEISRGPGSCPVRAFQRGEIRQGPRALGSSHPVSREELIQISGLDPGEIDEGLKVLRERGWLEVVPCNCGLCGGDIYLFGLGG